jgi:predicted amidophosphoribosyltransferase
MSKRPKTISPGVYKATITGSALAKDRRGRKYFKLSLDIGHHTMTNHNISCIYCKYSWRLKRSITVRDKVTCPNCHKTVKLRGYLRTCPCGHSWFDRGKGHNKCSKCTKTLGLIEKVCECCEYEWRGSALRKSGRCPRCRQRRKLPNLRWYDLLLEYKEDGDLILLLLKLDQKQEETLLQFQRYFCMSGAARRLNISRERVRQRLQEVYKQLSKPSALTALIKARSLFGKPTGLLEKYLACSQAMGRL